MKKLFVVFALVAVSALWADGVGVQVKAPLLPAVGIGVATPAAPAPEPISADEPGPCYCLGRGLANLTTCWVEIPRCMVYDISKNPVAGSILCLPDGVCLTLARVFSGLYDVLALGFTGNSVHDEIFPDFVFQSPWIYSEK